MLILGIESSCDETGIALYETESGLLNHQLHSQIKLHALYGGVVPELASRDHIRRIIPLLEACLQKSSKQLNDIDVIAYTQGPGLGGALLVGASFAHALGFALNIPTLPVHHLEGHLLSPFLAETKPAFPFLALLISGGHTQIMAVYALGNYEILGETLDDAVGEAFDKTAKLLGIPYPGGAELSRLAEQGCPDRFIFPKPMLHTKSLDMSFSGLKTSVLTEVQLHLSRHHDMDNQTIKDVCCAFQAAVVEVLVAKCKKALNQTGFKTLVVAGGVGANKQLRQNFNLLAKNKKINVFYPPLEFCTDNGAMIALVGALKVKTAIKMDAFTTKPRWPLIE
ncbi:MAG: tRNA (adenosine(37)-N6)-threonylcarbamoyltransferase complex transferase subunit TsaD [Neisseriaceae bacterium]|nr:tRNA (adenosine(37)-N6)-threonylcarbamoyltransferase complex transferase subunit TsaD [Neisseriaceae bacterium]